MSLVLSAVLPHCPLLHPTIGEASSNELLATRAAMQTVARECYSAKITTLVVVAPHEATYEHAFALIGAPLVISEYRAFGDGVSSETYPVNTGLVSRIVEHAKKQGVLLSLLPHTTIHYGTAIPLLAIKNLLPSIQIVVISPPKTTTSEDLLAFGYLLRETIGESSARVALIASADLAHTLSKQSNLPFEKEAASLQNHLLRSLETNDATHLFNVTPHSAQQSGLCGFAPITVLLGAIANTHPHISMLSYEMVEGVGYAVAVYSYSRRV